jgi:hypothetical protein
MDALLFARAASKSKTAETIPHDIHLMNGLASNTTSTSQQQSTHILFAPRNKQPKPSGDPLVASYTYAAAIDNATAAHESFRHLAYFVDFNATPRAKARAPLFIQKSAAVVAQPFLHDGVAAYFCRWLRRVLLERKMPQYLICELVSKRSTHLAWSGFAFRTASLVCLKAPLTA